MMRALRPHTYRLTRLLAGSLVALLIGGLPPAPMQAAPVAVAQIADTTARPPADTLLPLAPLPPLDTLLAADPLLIADTTAATDTAGTPLPNAATSVPAAPPAAPLPEAVLPTPQDATIPATQEADTTAGQDANTTGGQDAGNLGNQGAGDQDAGDQAANPNGGQPEIVALLRELEREAGLLEDRMTQQFELLRGAFTLTRLLLFVLALVLTYLLVRLVVWILKLLAYWRPGLSSQIRKLTPFVRFGLWLVAVWVIVGTLFGGSTVLLVVLVLILTVVFVYLVFQLLRDLLGGLVLLVEQPFVVGSRITLGPHNGRVQRIGLRSFQLRGVDGAAVVVPNRTVLRHAVNSTPPETREGAVTVPVPFPTSIDVDLAHRLACEAAYVSPYIYAPRPVTAVLHGTPATPGLDHLNVTAYAFDARYREALASDILRLATQAFIAHTGRSPDTR